MFFYLVSNRTCEARVLSLVPPQLRSVANVSHVAGDRRGHGALQLVSDSRSSARSRPTGRSRFGLHRLPGAADPLRRELLQFRRPRPAHRLPVGGGHRILTVSCPAPSTIHLLAPLRFSPGSSQLSIFFGAAANISSSFVGPGCGCGIPSAWIDSVRAPVCGVSPNRAVSPGLRSSHHGAH